MEGNAITAFEFITVIFSILSTFLFVNFSLKKLDSCSKKLSIVSVIVIWLLSILSYFTKKDILMTEDSVIGQKNLYDTSSWIVGIIGVFYIFLIDMWNNSRTLLIEKVNILLTNGKFECYDSMLSDIEQFEKIGRNLRPLFGLTTLMIFLVIIFSAIINNSFINQFVNKVKVVKLEIFVISIIFTILMLYPIIYLICVQPLIRKNHCLKELLLKDIHYKDKEDTP